MNSKKQCSVMAMLNLFVRFNSSALLFAPYTFLFSLNTLWMIVPFISLLHIFGINSSFLSNFQISIIFFSSERQVLDYDEFYKNNKSHMNWFHFGFHLFSNQLVLYLLPWLNRVYLLKLEDYLSNYPNCLIFWEDILFFFLFFSSIKIYDIKKHDDRIYIIVGIIFKLHNWWLTLTNGYRLHYSANQ